MKPLILATALLSYTAMAHDECHVEIDNEIQLENRLVTIQMEKDHTLKLDGNKVWLNGTALTLNSAQQQHADDYYQRIVETAPQAAKIALDAVALASEGLTLAFSELTGEDSELVTDIRQEFADFRSEMNAQFYDDKGEIRFTFNPDDDSNFFGNDFENRMEDRIERLVERSMGSLFMALGSEMMFGDGLEAFEEKMENFGDRIEDRMEDQAEQIESRADALCRQLVKIDQAESQLSQHVAELSKLDAFHVRHDK